MKFDWEDIFYKDNIISMFVTSRAKVDGGWMVHQSLFIKGNKVSSSMCFMPDPQHEWSIE